MWVVKSLTYRRTVLDFASSGQGQQPVTALYGDDVCLVNALSLTEFEGPNLQVQICEDCGIVGCSVGGWICLRRLGTKVLLVPCFDLMSEKSDEFAPPQYRLGTPALSRELYDGLAERVPGFPAFELVAEIRSRDLSRLMQANAPSRVLGVFPENPELNDAHVVATGGNRDIEVAALADLLRLAFVDDVAVQPARGEPIPFHLSIRGTAPWSPLARADDRYLLCIAGEAMALRPEETVC